MDEKKTSLAKHHHLDALPEPAKKPTKKRARKPAPANTKDDTNISAETEQAYVDGVLTRGEAAPAGQKELLPGQTHRVIEGEGDGKSIERERFSAY